MAQITLRDYLQETEDALRSGRIDDAQTKCEQMLAQFPEALEVQRLLGEVYLAQKHLKEAQLSFDWVLTNDPENVIAYCSRALISEQQADYDTALDCYQQAYELSRGNSDIRQQFNNVSQKAGQQGFMLSRAGLARLYMRGDLLTQAMLEWETVLTSSPDRSDAQMGLLETYWREGLYERVEQLATQILQRVPECEKALLLLAYVTSLKNMAQARELMQRAEKLDPDLLMAHDLFSDLLSSQPAEPFLDLLKKAPATITTAALNGARNGATLEDVAPQMGQPSSWSGLEHWGSEGFAGQQAFSQEPLAAEAPLSSNESAADILSWSTLPEPDAPFSPALPVQPALDQIENGALRQEPTEPQGEPQREAWEILQDALGKANAQGGNISSLPPEVWESLDKYLQFNATMPESQTREPEAVATPPESTPSVQEPANRISESPQSEPAKDSAPVSQPPAEKQREVGGTSAEELVQKTTPPAPQSFATPAATAPASSSSTWQGSASPPANPVEHSDDEEESFFSPSWLRSLGAASIGQDEEESQNQPEASAEIATPQETSTWRGSAPSESMNTATPPVEPLPERSVAQEPETPSWLSTLQQSTEEPRTQAESAEPSWFSPLQQQQQPAQEPSWFSTLQQQPAEEPSWLASLQAETASSTPRESSEQSNTTAEDMPAWMASFSQVPEAKPAQEADSPPSEPEIRRDYEEYNTVPAATKSSAPAEENVLTTLHELEQGLFAQGFVPLEPNTLAELARQNSSPDLSSTPEPSIPLRSEPEPAAPSLSSALAEFGSYTPQAANGSSLPTQTEPEKSAQETVPWAAPLVTPSVSQAQPVVAKEQPEEFAPQEVVPTYTASNASQRSSQRAQEAPAASSVQPAPTAQRSAPPPAFHIDPLLDSELETTMRRPAVRLQPVPPPQRSAGGTSVSPARSSARPAPSRANEQQSAGGYQERLIKGYQHQLVGDYDEAMQEYRLIIRSAPDLLGEVVSNVRALLKLAPRYSAGYRVLGDAYMRQGEYLQAMEAYNKALTMAKKK